MLQRARGVKEEEGEGEEEEEVLREKCLPVVVHKKPSSFKVVQEQRVALDPSKEGGGVEMY